MVKQLTVATRGQGLHEITNEVARALREAKIGEGLCTVFVRHTSASLVIQENADPSARHDLEQWLARLVPEDDPEFTHKAVLLVTEPAVPKDWYETPGGVSPPMLPPRNVKATLTKNWW